MARGELGEDAPVRHAGEAGPKARLWREGAHCPRMLSVGLHLRIIGRPARIGGLERVLNHMRSKGGAWFARRDEIARHWLREHPPA